MREQKQEEAQVEVQVYQPPEVTTYSDEDILEAIGPAQAVTGAIIL